MRESPETGGNIGKKEEAKQRVENELEDARNENACIRKNYQ